MLTHLRFYIAFIALALSTMPVWAANWVLYVSQEGNDAWSGTLESPNSGRDDGPLRTLAHTQELVRAYIQDESYSGVRIYIRGGDYFLDKPLQFSAEDSGTAEFPVVWQSFQEESVRFVGGVAIEGWEKHNDTIFMATLPDQVDATKVKQLFENSKRQTLARWPNINPEGMPGGDWAFIDAEIKTDNKKSFIFLDDHAKAWSDISGLEVSIWPNHNWWQTIAGVASFKPDTGVIQLNAELPYEIMPGRRFYFQNIFSELDAPGEWFVNAEERKLYFLPEQDTPGEVIVPVLDNILIMENAKHIKFIGFSLEDCNEHAVVLKNTEECLVAKNIIRNAGGRGVHVEGGKSATIHGNDIHSTGKGGIYLEGGDRKTLTPGGHQAINNHISRFGELFQTYHTGIQVAGVGQRAAHNLIHDGPHIGILLGGNDHILEYNEIYDVCQQGSDNGAFYMGRDWTQRGNVIRYNKFHDVYGFGLSNLEPNSKGAYEYESPHQAWGVYLDDCSSGVVINGNIFYRIPLCGVMIGGGRDNVITNNIFYDCIPALHIDDRWDSYPWEVMQERLEAMNYKEPPYSERYPELLTMGDDPRRPENNRFESNIIEYTPDNFRGLSTTKENPESAIVYHFDQFDPKSTIINRNIIWHNDLPVRIFWSEYQKPGTTELTWDQWLEKGYDEGSFIQPPEFIDHQQDDYMLPHYAAEHRLPFEKLPWLSYGLYQDELRASWPPPTQEPRTLPERKTWTVNTDAKP